MGGIEDARPRLLLSIVLMACSVTVRADKKTVGSEACAELGFGEALRCSTCQRLSDFLPSGDQKGGKEAATLTKDCLKCCSDEGDEVFAKAIFHVSKGLVEADQDIEDFVKRKAPAFKNLKIEYSMWGVSSLQLLRKDETEESAKTFVNIGGWKSDEIKDFIKLKLGAKSSATS